MIQPILIVLLLGLVSCSVNNVDEEKVTKTIVAVLAHPDDESAMAQILSRYAREGHKVYLVIATDGRYSAEEHAGIPAGDTLARVRMNETICACEILGIEKPVFLEAHDLFGVMNGVGEYLKQTADVKQKLSNVVAELNPDVIITFGPDGDTGHPDHKGIGDLVTEILLMNDGWYEKYPLFYLAWPREKVVWVPQGEQTSLNYVADRYRNIHIKYIKEDQEKSFRSLECYKSQFTNEDIEKWIEAELKDTTYTMYFRQFSANTKVRESFFE